MRFLSGLIFRAEIFRDSQFVEPRPEKLRQIFPAFLLDRRADFVVANLLAAKQSNDSLKRRTHGRFSAFVFERNEKQRRLRKADGTLFRRIGKLRSTKRDFDSFLRSLIIRA